MITEYNIVPNIIFYINKYAYLLRLCLKIPLVAMNFWNKPWLFQIAIGFLKQSHALLMKFIS